MRKKTLFGIALMTSLAFYSCTKEVVIVEEGKGSMAVEDGQVLTLQVANAGDGLTSRAGRPLLSAQAKQDINTVVLYVVGADESESTMKGKVVLKKTISAGEWANALTYSNTDGHGKQLQITFRASDNQALKGDTEGISYDIYAVGYKTDSNYKLTDSDFGLSGTVPTTFPTDGTYSVSFTANSFATKLNSDTNPADEIFAGKVSVKVVTDAEQNSYIIPSTGSAGTKNVPSLVLNRQVAGATGYFTNLPVNLGGEPAAIRLVASGKSNKIHFTSLVSGETNSSVTTKNVINGSSDNLTASEPYFDTTKKGYLVYEVKLADFFPMLGEDKEAPAEGKYTFADLDLDKDGVVGYKDAQHYVYGQVPTSTDDWSTAIQGNQGSENLESGYNSGKTKKLADFWKNPNETKQTLVAGSVFAGEFIIPFLQKTDCNTLELQLVDADGKVLRNWNVQVPAADKVETSEGSLAEGITGTSWSADTSTLIYSIYRNHLYSLGLKTTDVEGGDEGDGGDDDDEDDTPKDPKPEPDDDDDDTPEDQPEDLSKGQNLNVHVNDNWEIIHQMIID